MTCSCAPGLKPVAVRVNVSPCLPGLGENDAAGFSAVVVVEVEAVLAGVKKLLADPL